MHGKSLSRDLASCPILPRNLCSVPCQAGFSQHGGKGILNLGFATIPLHSVRGQADAAVFDGDVPLLQQGSEGLFEGALADAKFVVDLGSGAVVADGPVTAAGFELGEDAVFEVLNPGAAGRVQGEIDFAIVPNGGDVAFGFLARLERLENAFGI